MPSIGNGSELILERELRAIQDKINEERDRRINDGFVFNGVEFQFTPDSRENIMGAANSATIAIAIDNVSAGNLFWHGELTPFVFLSKNNVPVPMDAHTAVEFGKAAAKWKSLHIFAARALKDTLPLPPLDFDNDTYWP